MTGMGMEGVRRKEEKWANKGCRIQLYRWHLHKDSRRRGHRGPQPAHAMLYQCVCPDTGCAGPAEGGTLLWSAQRPRVD